MQNKHCNTHFLDTTIISNNQSCGTTGNMEIVQLRSCSSLPKKRSPCNQLRDTQRVKDHRKDMHHDIDFQATCKLENCEESASECDNLLLSAVQENNTGTGVQQSDFLEQDSGFAQKLESTALEQGLEAKPNLESQPSECNIQSDNNKKEKKVSKHSGTKHNSAKSRAGSAQRSFKDFEQMKYEYDNRHHYQYRTYRPYYGHGYWNSSSTRLDSYDFT